MLEEPIIKPSDLDRPVIHLDADNTIFEHHLFNNPTLAFYAATLVDRINKYKDSDPDEANKCREILLENFIKQGKSLSTTLMKAQSETNAYIAIASYSDSTNSSIMNYDESSKAVNRDKDLSFRKKIEGIIDNLKDIGDWKNEKRILCGPDFLRNVFEAAFPNIQLSSVAAFFPKDKNGKTLPHKKWEKVGKTQHIKQNLRDIHGVNDIENIYYQRLNQGTCILVDDDKNNVKIFNNVSYKIDGHSRAILVDSAEDHVSQLNTWVEKIIQSNPNNFPNLFMFLSSNGNSKSEKVQNSLHRLSMLENETNAIGISRKTLSDMRVITTQEAPFYTLSETLNGVKGDAISNRVSYDLMLTETLGWLFNQGSHFRPRGVDFDDEPIFGSLKKQFQHPETIEATLNERKHEAEKNEKIEKEQRIKNLVSGLASNHEMRMLTVDIIKGIENDLIQKLSRNIRKLINWENKEKISELKLKLSIAREASRNARKLNDKEVETNAKEHYKQAKKELSNAKKAIRVQRRKISGECENLLKGLNSLITELSNIKEGEQVDLNKFSDLLENSPLLNSKVLAHLQVKLQEKMLNVIRSMSKDPNEKAKIVEILNELIDKENEIERARTNSDQAISPIAESYKELRSFIKDEITGSKLRISYFIERLDKDFFEPVNNLYQRIKNPDIAELQFDERMNQAKQEGKLNELLQEEQNQIHIESNNNVSKPHSKWRKINHEHYQEMPVDEQVTTPNLSYSTITISGMRISNSNTITDFPVTVTVRPEPGIVLTFNIYEDKIQFDIPNNLNNQPDEIKKIYCDNNLHKVYFEMAKYAYANFDNLTIHGENAKYLAQHLRAESEFQRDINNKEMKNFTLNLEPYTPKKSDSFVIKQLVNEEKKDYQNERQRTNRQLY